VAACRRCPSVDLRSGVSPRSFLAPRTVAARSRKSSAPVGARPRGPAAFHRADLALTRSAIRMSEVRLGSRAVAVASSRRSDDSLRLGFAPRPGWDASTSCGGPTRLLRQVHDEDRAEGARSTSPRGGPSGANRSVGSSSPRGRGEVSTPVDSDRCVQLTIPFSKLGAPRLGSLHPAPTRRGTPGFTPERRFGELALHVRAFLPDASCGAYLWYLVAPSADWPLRCCGFRWSTTCVS